MLLIDFNLSSLFGPQAPTFTDQLRACTPDWEGGAQGLSSLLGLQAPTFTDQLRAAAPDWEGGAQAVAQGGVQGGQ